MNLVFKRESSNINATHLAACRTGGKPGRSPISLILMPGFTYTEPLAPVSKSMQKFLNGLSNAARNSLLENLENG